MRRISRDRSLLRVNVGLRRAECTRRARSGRAETGRPLRVTGPIQELPPADLPAKGRWLVPLLLAGGMYNVPAFGTPFVQRDKTVSNLYGPLPVGYIKLQAEKTRHSTLAPC